MCVTREALRDASCGGAIQIDYLYLFTVVKFSALPHLTTLECSGAFFKHKLQLYPLTGSQSHLACFNPSMYCMHDFTICKMMLMRCQYLETVLNPFVDRTFQKV